MTTALLLALSLATPGRAAQAAAAPAPPPAAPSAADPAAAASTTTTPSMIYTTEKLRDPFVNLGGGGAAASSGKAFDLAQFSVHNLQLRGMMQDSSADYALFADGNSGLTFILRRGKLYDPRNKPVPGVTGQLKVKQKWAQLVTSEGEVQIFRLGEDEKK